MAVYEDNALQNIYIEKKDNKPKEGEVYIGEIKNILPSLKGAFVDIGFTKNVFLYLDNRKSVKKGDKIALQITKEEEEDKSPKGSQSILFPGRYIMLQTRNEKIEFSKNLEESFKENLLSKFKLYEGTGVIIRSAAKDVSIEEINKEYEYLYKIYLDIMKKEEFSKSSGLVEDFMGTLGKLLRDLPKEVHNIIVNEETDKKYIEEFMKDKEEFGANIIQNKDNEEIFMHYKIEDDILKLLDRKVNLPSKGNIKIDKTEAMYVIDVNSGKNIKEKSINETAFITNMEAALAIPKEIRLRNLSGIIIVDFIDLKEESKRQQVFNTLKEGFKEDRLKPSIYPFTELNLIQISRKKVTPISTYLQDKKNVIDNKRLSPIYLATLINNRLKNELEEPNIYISSKYKDKEIEIVEFIKELRGREEKIIFKDQEKDFLIRNEI